MKLFRLSYFGFLLAVLASAPVYGKLNDRRLIEVAGYVKADVIVDSRQVDGSREDFIIFFPERKLLDSTCHDKNSPGQFHMYPLETRLRVTFSGPDVFDAKAHGVIEVDLLGRPFDDDSLDIVRLRHAFLEIEWEHTTLLFGQTWHPMFSELAFPHTLTFGAGLPLAPFSRNPQVRLTHRVNNVETLLFVGSQIDFTNVGIIGGDADLCIVVRDSQFARNSLIPNVHMQARFYWDEYNVIGAGADFKAIMPRLVSCADISDTERLFSAALMAFAKVRHNDWTAKSQFTFGHNIDNLSMIGGYGVACVDKETDRRRYTNLTTAAVWLDVSRSGDIEPGIFIGYSKNLGAGDSLAPLEDFQQDFMIQSFRDIVFGRGNEIDDLWRVAPRVYWHVKPVVFGAEITFTRAAFGTINQCGKVENTCPVNNFRFQAAAYYYF